MNDGKITLRDLYEVQRRIEEKMDNKFEDHEKRIRSAEAFQARATTLFGIISVFSGAIASFIWSKITGTTQ